MWGLLRRVWKGWPPMFGWEEFDAAKIKGTLVAGSEKALPPVRSDRRAPLRMLEWETEVVFEVPYYLAACGYRVGCRMPNGRALLRKGFISNLLFRRRIGCEDRVFFAVDGTGKEVPLTEVSRIEAPLI